MADKSKSRRKEEQSGKSNASDQDRIAPSRKRKRGTGNPGYAGYEYQIEVTIWIALDLMLAKAGTDALNIEPPSHEDIEASIQDPDNALLGLAAQTADLTDLIFQIKTRSSSPWSSKDFAKILTGEANRKGGEDRRRSRPLDMLTADPRRRYIFITNEALSQSLRVYQGQEIFDFPDVAELPPYTRQGDPGKLGAKDPVVQWCDGGSPAVSHRAPAFPPRPYPERQPHSLPAELARGSSQAHSGT